MHICGVIAEYNPFHLGHAYHLHMARSLSECEYLIVVMSGSFVQRGEPAIMDKWTRAACALRNGADLVVELPARFAVRSAEAFARGGAEILCRLCADDFCFGCESEREWLEAAARALETESEELSAAIRAGLDRGETLARARGEALERVCGIPNDILAQPNTALAVEYLRANMRLGTPMRPLSVARRGEYHQPLLPDSPEHFASASALRACLRKGEWESVLPHIPENCAQMVKRVPLSETTGMDSLLLYLLRSVPPATLANLCDAGEGVEMRLIHAARGASDRATLLESAKCKRYTRARLERLCAQALLGLYRQTNEAPAYARVLGFRRDAGALMRWLKENARIPICTDAALWKSHMDFQLDAAATDLFGLCTGDTALRRAGMDYRHPPVIL